MKSKLLKGVEEDQQNEVRGYFKEAVRFRKRLNEVLDEEIDSLHKSMRDEDLWKTPNWELIQADRVAQVKALKQVISLLNE